MNTNSPSSSFLASSTGSAATTAASCSPSAAPAPASSSTPASSTTLTASSSNKPHPPRRSSRRTGVSLPLYPQQRVDPYAKVYLHQAIRRRRLNLPQKQQHQLKLHSRNAVAAVRLLRGAAATQSYTHRQMNSYARRSGQHPLRK